MKLRRQKESKRRTAYEVLDVYKRQHAGSRTKFAGTGLGMPITKKLVEKMDGTITFESKEGVGTTFVIRLPFKINLYADKREEQKDVSEKSIKGLHILLAEDNELNMEIAEFMLQNEGADVTKAWNGQEAVELFRNSEPGEFVDAYEVARIVGDQRRLDGDGALLVATVVVAAEIALGDGHVDVYKRQGHTSPRRC